MEWPTLPDPALQGADDHGDHQGSDCRHAALGRGISRRGHKGAASGRDRSRTRRRRRATLTALELNERVPRARRCSMGFDSRIGLHGRPRLMKGVHNRFLSIKGSREPSRLPFYLRVVLNITRRKSQATIAATGMKMLRTNSIYAAPSAPGPGPAD